MPIHISRLLYDRIVMLARSSPDLEVCGLLLGMQDRIMEVREAPNVAQNPRTHFEIDPAVLLATHREARQGGAQVIGHHHSHPNGSSEPSVTDAAEARDDGSMWLIVGRHDVQLWQATNEGLHGRFKARQLIVDAH